MALAIDALRKGIATHHLQTRKLPEDAPSILVGIPTRDPRLDGGRWAPDFVWGLLQMQRPSNFSFSYECVWDGSVTENRQRLTERAIEKGSKYLVLFDDDMILPLHTLNRLVDDLATLPDAAIVTGLICKKRPEGDPEIFKSWNSGRYWDWKKDVVEEIWACGAACMAIDLDYVRKMKSPYWIDETVHYRNVQTEFTEDLNFCRKIQDETGGKVYLDTHVICGHLDIKTGEVYFPKKKSIASVSTIETKIKNKNLKPRNNPNHTFIVTGVGRTGTSTVARLLHEHYRVPMGCDVTRNNFYEDMDFVRLNEKVILGHISYFYFLAELEELVKARDKEYLQWGLKDPKTSYLLGTYLSIIKEPTIIRCNRDKNLVIDSLIENYGWDKEKAKRIYIDRTIRLDNILDGRDHQVIDFGNSYKTDAEIINILNQLF